MPEKLDEQEKTTKNLKQQIKHTKERISDAEYALEHGDMEQQRKEELRVKNEHRREDIQKKLGELDEEE